MREVIKVKPLNNYSILVQFDNGEQRIKDIKPLLDKPIFRCLKNIVRFNTVCVKAGAVTWINETGDIIDLCPDNTYNSSVPVNS